MRLIAILIILMPVRAFGQPAEMVIGQAFQLSSQILGEERRFFVQLPDSYNNDAFYTRKRYPVLVLLDGATHFHAASGVVRSLSAPETEQIPELIVVAVPNTNRNRDLTPDAVKSGEDSSQPVTLPAEGSAAFLRFLELELLPRIEQDYRTLPYRVLAGHSLGGLFAVDAFLQRRVFNAYLAIDPSLAWANQAIIKRAVSILNTDTSFQSTIYMAQANNPFNEGPATDAKGKAIQAFTAALRANKSAALRFHHEFFPQEDHFSVPLLSLYHGLRFIFEGYPFPLRTLKDKNAADVRNHYTQLAKRLSVAIVPPGKLLNQVGFFLLYSEKAVDKAIDLLKLNAEYYSDSYIPYNSLGDAYKVKGDKKLALANYQKSLALNAANENASKGIKELTPK